MGRRCAQKGGGGEGRGRGSEDEMVRVGNKKEGERILYEKEE